MNPNFREDLIRKRAFEIFEWRQANGIEGTAESDWLEAEDDIREWEKFPGRYRYMEL